MIFKFPSYIFSIQFAASSIDRSSPALPLQALRQAAGSAGWYHPPRLQGTSHTLRSYLFTRLKPTEVIKYLELMVRTKTTPFLFCPRCSNKLGEHCSRQQSVTWCHSYGRTHTSSWWLQCDGPCPPSCTHPFGHASTTLYVCWPKRCGA